MPRLWQIYRLGIGNEVELVRTMADVGLAGVTADVVLAEKTTESDVVLAEKTTDVVLVGPIVDVGLAGGSNSRRGISRENDRILVGTKADVG